MLTFLLFACLCAGAVATSPSEGSLNCTLPVYKKLILLATAKEGNHNKCKEESGFDFFQMKSLPTDDFYSKMCKSSNCFKLVDDIIGNKEYNCIVETQIKFNPYVLAKAFPPKCDKLGVKPLAKCEIAAYRAFLEILPKPTSTACVKDAGFSIVKMKAYPTDAEYKKICSSKNCDKLMKDIASFGKVMDCKYEVAETKFHINPFRFANSVPAKCETLSNDCTDDVVLKLNSFATSSELLGCMKETNFPLLEMKSAPTTEDYQKLCASVNCVKLVNNVQLLGRKIDCDLALNEFKYNPLELASSFAPKCISLGIKATPAPTSPSLVTKESKSRKTKLPTTESPNSSSSAINPFFNLTIIAALIKLKVFLL